MFLSFALLRLSAISLSVMCQVIIIMNRRLTSSLKISYIRHHPKWKKKKKNYNKLLSISHIKHLSNENDFIYCNKCFLFFSLLCNSLIFCVLGKSGHYCSVFKWACAERAGRGERAPVRTTLSTSSFLSAVEYTAVRAAHIFML